ncbi:MAG TPA: MBL fold metallo-hydrolase [Candidatus Paceibacterota bacterium]|nr:MBL fold metallo-hydrolase [Candidatus Paceibacterota bacterium]
MKITKFGQCCLLIEVNGKRILTDPGRFTHSQDEVTNVDLILITHEHADHLHADSLHAILTQNPDAIVVTNSAVGKILQELGITHSILEGRVAGTHAGVTLEAYDGEHVEIFEDFGIVQNTGYFIAEELFYPGDAFTNPGKPVPVLALPIAGPWCKAADAIRYALEVQPTKAFPVHDWLLNEDGVALYYGLFTTQLTQHDITFVELRNGESKEL